MKSWIAVGFALAISMSAVAKESMPTVFTTYTHAEVVIEADGQVSDIKFVGQKLGNALESSLSAKIRAPDLFQAGLLNRKPARTHSMMRLQLRAESDLKDKQTLFSLHDISVSTMFFTSGRNYPVYPESMLRNQREAEVIVQVSYDAEGTVTDARVNPTQPRLHLDFERSALRYARRLKFFVEEVGGVAQGGSATVPVFYKIISNDQLAALYTFKLPSGVSIDMQPGEPKPDVTSTKTQASLSKPFVPQALTDG